MSPTEVTEKLKLNQLKDKVWYVQPSCATTGDGLFEGLVSHIYPVVLLPAPPTQRKSLTCQFASYQGWLSNNVKDQATRQNLQR